MTTTTTKATAFESVEERVQEACPVGAKLFRWGLRKTWADGGEDPMEKIWAYACDDERPHWHYVTSGLADPEKVAASPGSSESGCGYELTFRLLREADDTEAPTWPVTKLQEMGWGILKSQMKLGAGHYLRSRSVLTGGTPPTELLGYYLIDDPKVAPTRAASGNIAFLQLVGVTEDELLRCEAGEPDEMEADLRAASPLGITDLARTTPEADEIDLLQLSALQRALVEHCLRVLPSGAPRFTVSASQHEGKLVTEARAELPFRVDGRAEATLRRIFRLHAAAGSELESLEATVVQQPDGSWSQAMSFAYPT